MPSPRNISLDLVKAIGMVAIIAGHFSIGVQFVFSFHVPLFFIVGGYLFRQKSMAVEWWTDVKRLLFPYALTSLAILCWDSMYAIHSKDYSVIRERIVEIILGGGTSQEYILLGGYGQIGAIWFLLALMVCRLVYNGLNQILTRNVLSGACLGLSIGAILVYKYIGALPWDILQGLSALVFYDIGRRIKDSGGFENIPLWGGIILTGVWIAACMATMMSICSCRYDCYPLNIVGAVGATWAFWKVCNMFSRIDTKVVRAMAWFGRNSLAVLCLHLFDLETGIIHKIQHWTIDLHYHNDYAHVSLQILIICGLIYGWDIIKIKYKTTICKNS